MLEKIKSYLESIKVSPASWLVGVSGVLMVRFFLESISNPTSTGFFASDASTLIHYYLFFMVVLVVFMIIFQLALPEMKKIIPQLTAVSSLVIFVAPIFDWLISAGKGFKMTYFFNTPLEIVFSFLKFGDGATVGLRIEIAFVLLIFGFFIYWIKKDWRRAIVFPALFYLVIMILASIPSIVSFLGQLDSVFWQSPMEFFRNTVANSSTVSNHIHSSLRFASSVRMLEISFNFLMGKILFLVLAGVTMFWFYSNHKEKFLSIFRNSRPERVLHYLALVVIGILIAFALFPSLRFNCNDWLSVLMLLLSFYFSIMFAISTNDIVDEEIDAVSDPSRPLVAGTLSKEDLKQSAAIFLIASLISGFLAGYTAFFFVLAFTALYYIYSVPPTRYKLIPFFSSFIIGLCSLTAVMAGFFLASPLKYVKTFPAKFIVAVILIFFLGSHIRDLKDAEGDKKAGVMTVPVLFGDMWGPRVVGIFTATAFLLVPLFLGFYTLFLTAIPAALASWYYINKKPYSEKPIFKIYFAFMAISFLLLLI